MVKLPQIGEAMDCKELDRISRSGYSKIFEDEIRSVLKDIDLGINRTPIFLRYNAYDIKGFANEGNFFRIPCASRTVYCRKVHDFWNNKYEIVYRTNLNIYGHTSRYELMRSILIEFPDCTLDYNYPLTVPDEEMRARLVHIIRENIRPIVSPVV